MQRTLCVAAAALALLLSDAAADARTRVFARVKCAGLYCAIVPAPDPRAQGRPRWRRPGEAVARGPHA